MLRNATQEQIAWAAGLFEGEGSIRITSLESGTKRVRVSLGLTDPDVIRKFQSICGGTLYAEPRRASYKPIERWNLGSHSEVLEFLILMSPYLGARRREKAIEALFAIRSPRMGRKRTLAILPV